VQEEVLPSTAGAAMSERVLPAHAATSAVKSDADLPQPQVGSSAEFLFRIAERFGVPTVLCLLVLWWAKNSIVQPLMDAHFSFIDKIVKSQERHTDAIGTLGDKLDTLIQVSRNAAEKKAE
jgi:hypothetical protein